MVPEPRTPRKTLERTREQVEKATQAVTVFKAKVSDEWNLDLDTTGKSEKGELDIVRERCVRILKSLCWRELESNIWDTFNTQAIHIQNRWQCRPDVLKDGNESGTRSAQQESELLGCLYRVLKEQSERVREISTTPSSRHSTTAKETEVDDRPVPFTFEAKRLREDAQDTGRYNLNKKPKPAFSRPQLPRSKTSENPVFASGGGGTAQNGDIRSANTSFSSVFDAPSGITSTQATSLDGACDEDSSDLPQSQLDVVQSSYYGTAPEDEDFADPSIRDSLGLGQKMLGEKDKQEVLTRELNTAGNDLAINEMVHNPKEKMLKDQLEGVFRKFLLTPDNINY